jgi:tetratricopeptide (TPR) repeat protein
MTKSVHTLSSARLLYSLPLILLAGCGSPEERAQGFYEKGMELIAKKDDLGARVQLLSAAKYKADRVDVWRALVGVEERLKSGPSVFQDLRRVVELDPNDLEAKVKLARVMVAGGASDAALKLVETANDSDKPNAPLHALKANILLRTNDPAGAVREAQRALEIDSSNVDASMLVAAKKVADGDTDGALKLLNALPATDPRDQLRISLQKVQVFVRKGDLPQAETLLRKLVTENPKEGTLRAQLIQLYISAKRFDDAERELRATADAAPTDTKVGMDLVRFLVSAKGAKAARDELNARIKTGGDVFDYQIALAELDFAEGNLAPATESLQKLSSAATAPDHKLLAQTKLAEMYVSKGNTVAAEPIIADILQKDRRHTIGLRLRAAIKIDQGQVDSAIADLREALNDQPKSADLLMLMAAAYERGGKNELAERQYADALKASGLNPNIALRYVAFLQRRGDFSHAEDVLSDVVARNPTNTQLLATLAQIRLSRQNWIGALATADAVARLGDKSGLADQIRASALAGQNKIDDSVAALEKAHATAPDALQPVVSLVSDYVRLGKADKAEALLQEMIKKYPDSAEILVLMGQTKLAQNKNDDALKSYQAAIAKQPKDPNGYSALSDLYVREKNYNSAAEVIQAGLREQPGNLNFRFTSAGLQILKGDPTAAITQYEAILKDQPNAPIAINNLVSLILDNRTDKQSLDRAYALAEGLKTSTVPQFQDTYGWALYKKGDTKNAVAALEAAAAKLPDLAAVHYHLGISYAATEQPEKAKEQFNKALSLEPDGTPLKESIRSAMK